MEKSRLDALLADSDSDEDNPAGSPPSASLAPLTLGNALLDDSDDSEEESDTMALREQMAALGAAKQKAAARTARNEDAIEGPEVQHDTSQELTEPETQTQEVEPSEQADAGEKIRKDNRAVVKEEAQDVLLPDTLSNLIEYAQPSPSINVDENCSAVDLSLEVDRKVETEGIRQDEATAQETNPLSIIDPQAVIEMDTAETERERHFESTRVVAEGLGHRIVDEVPSSMQCNDTSFEIEAAHQELPVTQETSLEKEPAVMEVMSAETGDATFTQGEEDDHQLNSSEEAGNAQIADPDPIHTPSKSQGQLAAEEAMLAMGLALPSLSPEPPPALASPLPGASSGSDESNASLLPPSSSSPKEHEASSIVPPIPQTTAQPDVSNLLPMPSTSPYPSQCVAPNSPPPFPTPSKAEVVDSEAEPGGQSMLAPPPPTPKSANATVSPNRSPNVPSISTPSPSSSPSFAAAEKVASSRGHTTMARLLAERQLREEQELQRQQQQQQQLEPVPMASLDDDTDESTKEGSSGFAFIAAEASTPLPDTLHIDAPSGNSQNVSNEQTNHEKHTNAGGVLSNVSDDNDGNGHSNNISSTDRMPLSPRAGPPVWHELPVNAAPQQLGFRPASPSLDGLCLRRIEITWALDASWDDFCDVARTVFMSQGLRTSRPHVAQLCVTRNENNSNNSSSSSSYDHRGGDAFSAGKGAQSMNIPGYGALAQWGLLRCTVGVTAQRLRTVVLEVCTRPLPGGPAAHAAAQALLSYSNGGNNSGSSTTDGYKSSNSNNMSGSSTSSYGGGNGGRGSGGFAQDQQWPKPGEEVVAVLRDAMRGFRLPDDRDNANVQKDTGGEGLFSTPAYSHSLLAQQQPNLASPSSSLLALANQAASAPLRLPVGLDPLYVLQVTE
jgi:RES domain-containing protein